MSFNQITLVGAIETETVENRDPWRTTFNLETGGVFEQGTRFKKKTEHHFVSIENAAFIIRARRHLNVGDAVIVIGRLEYRGSRNATIVIDDAGSIMKIGRDGLTGESIVNDE